MGPFFDFGVASTLRYMRQLVCGFWLLALASPISGAGGSDWPEVARARRTFDFPDARNASVRLKIRGTNRRPLYLLQCQTRDNARNSNFAYSGDFECRLTSLYSSDAYSTLLTDDPQQSRDWQSRGRVFAEHLIGRCGDYPEYGRVRSFRLRRMKLTLEFSHLRFVQGRRTQNPSEPETSLLESFRLEVRVEPAPDTLSEIAEPVPYGEPPLLHPGRFGDLSLDCENVIRIPRSTAPAKARPR